MAKRAVTKTEEPSETSEVNLLDDLPKEGLSSIELSLITEGENPREDFDRDALTTLKDSIRMLGLNQPILLRYSAGAAGTPYSIIAGERRFRVIRELFAETKDDRWREIPALIKQCSAIDALEIGLVENLERESLNPIEEARAFQKLMERGRNQTEIGHRVGRSQSVIANAIRMLKLPPSVQDLVRTKQLTATHAVALASIAEHPEEAAQIAEQAVTFRYSVEAVKQIVEQVKIKHSKQVSMEIAEPPVPTLPTKTEQMIAEINAEDDAPLVGMETEGAPDEEKTADEPGQSQDAPETVLERRDPSEFEQSAHTRQPVPEAAPRVNPQGAAVKPSAPTPPPAPRPAPTPPAPAVPTGFVQAPIKEADYNWFMEEGLWPLSSAKAMILSLRAALDTAGVSPEPEAAPTAPSMFSDPYENWHPVARLRLQKLVQMNESGGAILSERQTEILNDLFPDRETTTGDMIASVLVTRVFEIAKEAAQNVPDEGQPLTDETPDTSTVSDLADEDDTEAGE